MNTVNVLLTEIALNLLGNSFYDINGEPVDDLQSLYKSEPRTKDPSRPNLAELLGIFSPETAAPSPSPSVAPSSSPSATLETNDAIDDVITLEDDEDEDTEFLLTPYEPTSEEMPEIGNATPVQSASRIDATVPVKSFHTAPTPPQSKVSAPSKTASARPKAVPAPPKTAPAPPKPSNASFPASSAAPPNNTIDSNDSDLEEIECEEYESVDSSVRLKYIARQTDNEFNRMKANVRKSKRVYETGNRNLITLLKLKPKDVWKRFFDQQRQELIDESNVLMQFIRVIKNSDSINQKVLSKVAKDILAAKDTVT